MKPATKKKLRFALLISLISPLMVLLIYQLGLLKRFELMSYDALVKAMRLEKKAHPDIAVILIDDASLKAMNPLVGRWQWPRSVYADLLEFLYMGAPSAVAFDLLFTENERYGGAGISPNDKAFAEATAAGNIVYHAQLIVRDEEDEYNKGLLERQMPEDFRERFSLKGIKSDRKSLANNFYIPIKEIHTASKGIGVVEFSPDIDGVFRRTRPLRQYGQDYYPVLGLSPVIDSLGIKKISLTRDYLTLDDIRIPLAGDGHYLINMYGKFNTYSISGIFASLQKIRSGDVENLMVEPEEFKGKMVFIGASAAGVEDLKPTSISSATPGVLLHASLASNVLMKDFLIPASGRMTAFFVIVFSALSAFGVLMSSRLYQRLAVPLILFVLYLAIAVAGFGHNVLYGIVPPASALALSFISSFVYLSFTEGREKRKVRKMLGQYVSPQMLSMVVDKHEDFLKAEVGAKVEVTVLFSDIRGFTSISENMTPDRVVRMLNYYFSVWSDVIFKYGGMVDKFVGDAVMAVWGAPLKMDNHAEQAVKAASEMAERMPEVNNKLEAMGFSPIRIGIGINSGEAILGNIGSEKKLDYTVIGDTVNLASRMEGLTAKYTCDILISEYTFNRVKDMFPCVFVDKVKVKGKEVPVEVYKVEREN